MKDRASTMTTTTPRTDAYTEECRAAISALEEKFGIELVSIEHHELVQRALEAVSNDLAAASAELAQERERHKALHDQFVEMRTRWQRRDLYATQQEERAERAEARLRGLIADPVGEVSAPSGTLPYKHLVRFREPYDHEIGAKLCAIHAAIAEGKE